MTNYIRKMSGKQYLARMKECPTVIIPTGACEIYGPHLPMGTDLIVAKRIAELVAEKTGALIAPTIEAGESSALQAFSCTFPMPRKILEDYLDSFQGIVIAVSHDRYFLDRIARRIFAFEGDGAVRQYEGGFTDYQVAWEQIHGGDIPEPKKEKSSGPKEKPREKKLKFTYREQKEWETIEETIASLEEETAALEQEIEAAATDYEKLKELMARKEETERLLEEKMDRWMYLNDLAERIAAQQS